MYPVLICVPYDSLGCRTYDEFLLKLGARIDLNTRLVVIDAQTIVSYYGALFGETFYVLSLAAEERFRDEQWEISVLCTSLLEHKVELMLHFLPNSVAVGLDDHTSAYG